jgi:hypothetical protein
MALPATVTTAAGWSDGENSFIGPIEHGSALYCALHDKTNNHAEVWKSSDGGNTWAEQDAANHPSAATTNGRRSLSVRKAAVNSAGSAADVLVVGYNPNDKSLWREFNLSSDTWGTVGVSGGGSQGLNGAGLAGPLVDVIRRSDGTTVIVATGNTESIMGTPYQRVRIDRWSGTTWQAGVIIGDTVATNHNAGTVVLGASDRIHIIYRISNSTTLLHATFTSGNSLQTAQNIDTTVSAGNWFVGLGVLDGTTIRVPYVDSTGDLVEASTTSADTPTWSTFTTITSTNDPETANSNPAALAMDSSTVHRFWVNDADQDIYSDTSVAGTDAEWKDAVTCQGISIAKVTGGIGVLYDDGGTVKYDLFAISSGTTFTTSPTGTLTTAGLLTLRTNKALSGTLTTAGVLAKRPNVRYLGTLTTAGATTKRVNTSMSGTLATAGALSAIKIAVLAVGGTLTTAGALAIRVAKALGGTLTSSGALVRTVNHTLAGTLTTGGTLAQRVNKPLAGTLTTAGALANIKVAVLAAGGTLTTAGNLIRQTQQRLAGTLTTAGTMTRQTQTRLAGTLTSAGAVIREARTRLAGTLTASGALTPTEIPGGGSVETLSVGGTLTTSGTLVRNVHHTLGGTLTAAGTLTRRAQHALSGSLTTAGALAARVTQRVAGTLTSSGALAAVKLVVRSFGGVLATAGSLTTIRIEGTGPISEYTVSVPRWSVTASVPRWMVTASIPTWSATVSVPGWDATVHAQRWSATVSIPRWGTSISIPFWTFGVRRGP